MAVVSPKLKSVTWKLLPLMNRVLIKKAEPVKQTIGGILLPEDTKETYQRGTVIAVGPGKTSKKGELIPVDVKPGDDVILVDFGGIQIDLENEGTFHLYHDTELLAKLQK